MPHHDTSLKTRGMDLLEHKWMFAVAGLPARGKEAVPIETGLLNHASDSATLRRHIMQLYYSVAHVNCFQRLVSVAYSLWPSRSKIAPRRDSVFVTLAVLVFLRSFHGPSRSVMFDVYF